MVEYRTTDMDLKETLSKSRITARDAHNKSVGYEQFQLLMIDVYNLIKKRVNNGLTNTSYWIDIYDLADKVFHELVIQGYNVELQKDIGADKIWRLDIDWSDVDLDPNKKYILPMDDTRDEDGQCYAVKYKDGKWVVRYVMDRFKSKLAEAITAKDIEEAPDWVKALEPEEV